MTVRIIQGDCRIMLASLADQSVQCVVTSPPYFGLRDYGTGSWSGGSSSCDHVVGEIRTGLGMAKLGERYAGGGHKAAMPKPMTAKHTCPRCGAVRLDQQIGLEETPAEFVAELVGVFREVWRVLRDDGVCWLNLGDSYAGSRAGPQGPGLLADRSIASQRERRAADGEHQARRGAKHKDLLGIPWRVAFALQDDGWYLRRDVIWAKPNPMPESATDRPSTSHEYVFLLTKRPRYFYDAEAVREDRTQDEDAPTFRGGAYVRDQTDNGTLGKRTDVGNVKLRPSAPKGSFGGKTADQAQPAFRADYGSRNLRSVWTIATAPFAEAHFATFPPKLAETCIRAGTSEKGCCAACGAPWARTIAKGEPDAAHRAACGADASGGYSGQSTKGHDAAGVQNASDLKRRILEGMREKTYGWIPTCACTGAAVVPCVVLDPFGGAGTVGLVADRLGRSAILIELKLEYAEMARQRMVRDAPLFAEVSE